MRTEVNLTAITTKDISGTAIKTIRAGTKFTVTWADMDKLNVSWESSMCKGLDGISMLWNDEFKILSDEENEE